MKPRRLLKTKQRAQRLNRHLADASIRAKNPRCLMAHDAFSRQKVRGITRRIKVLQRWAGQGNLKIISRRKKSFRRIFVITTGSYPRFRCWSKGGTVARR